jgi:hypothetical protein
MAAAPKGVAGRRNSLPAQQAAADPLQTYCPDLDQWPRSWAYEACDIPPGLRLVECFKPFLRNLLALQLSRQTLRRHRDNIWALGGELIRALQMDSGLGPVDKLGPETNASEQDEAEETARGLVVSSGNTPLLLEMANEAFDA